MVRTILKYVAIGMVFLIIAAWLWSGGYRAVIDFVRTVPNPIDIIWGNSTSTYQVKLPWQIDVPQGPDIELLLDDADGTYADMSAEEKLVELQGQYDALKAEADRQVRSQWYGQVGLSRASATESDPSSEYVVLDARGSSAMSLQGWTLASSLTGIRVMIPPAAPVYQQGVLNTIQPVVLNPGESAIVVSGASPIGFSFRETKCTGYLSQSISFDPPVANSCPSPAETMSLTDQNLQRYGGDCVDYIRALPQCTLPSTIPTSLEPACRIYIANTFSYNGCVQAHRYERDYSLETWRLYLGASRELWANNHDVIRLLDERGQLVASITY